MQNGLTDWNDLRLVLGVARAGGLSGAAKALGLDHSTVFRRLLALEGKLGQPLFERLPQGRYAPTQAGQRVAAAAERMEDEALGAARDVAGRDGTLTGRLRVTASETLAYRVLPRHIAAFRRAHPGVLVEMSVDHRVLNLSRREADVALRPVRPREGDLWGRKLADLAWGIYGATDEVAQAGTLASAAGLAGRAMIGWEESASGYLAADWLTESAPGATVVYRTNSLIHQMVSARAGIGLAVLPCYLGDGAPGLTRALPGVIPDLRSELWMVTHTDLRRTARVRAFFDTVAEGIGGDRGLIEGRAG